jgi:hypothetical protein
MPKYQEKRTPIKGSASSTPNAAKPRTPSTPSADMTASIPSQSLLPKGTTALPRKTFEDQKRVDKVYRWR